MKKYSSDIELTHELRIKKNKTKINYWNLFFGVISVISVLLLLVGITILIQLYGGK